MMLQLLELARENVTLKGDLALVHTRLEQLDQYLADLHEILHQMTSLFDDYRPGWRDGSVPRSP